MNINLGCGDKPQDGFINVDAVDGEGVDVVCDIMTFLNDLPNGCVDKIVAWHVIEHFPDPFMILTEMHRVLAHGGTLNLRVPHPSCVSNAGCLGHYRTYCYDTLPDYLQGDKYCLKGIKFVTIYHRLNWWFASTNWMNIPFGYRIILKPMSVAMNFLTNLNPRLCENLWCYWIGGIREVEWVGIKI